MVILLVFFIFHLLARYIEFKKLVALGIGNLTDQPLTFVEQ